MADFVVPVESIINIAKNGIADIKWKAIYIPHCTNSSSI